MTIPGPLRALAIRSLLRNESFPICFLAPSDVKSSVVVATIERAVKGVAVAVGVNALCGRTKADAREVVHATARAVNVKRTMMCDL